MGRSRRDSPHASPVTDAGSPDLGLAFTCAAAAGGAGHGLRVLLVEDHDDLADALQANLRSEGFRASHARDGRQALALVRGAPPDIAVLDLGLPGMDGLTLLGRMRAEGHWCPVLILSARDAEADKLEGFRLGADDYVTKPFRPLELMARLHVMARRVARERAAVAPPASAAAPARTDGGTTGGELAAVAPEALAPEELVEACGLTLRQAEVALRIARGDTNPEIARALGISRFTVRNHAEQVLARLDIPSRWQVSAAVGQAVLRHRAGPVARRA